MKISGSLAPYVCRAASTCRAIRSRKVSPSRTGSSDLARSSPIEVPSPPLSLMITVPADRLPGLLLVDLHLAQQVGIGERLDLVLGDEAGAALLQLPVVIAEDVDRLFGDPGVGHLLPG